MNRLEINNSLFDNIKHIDEFDNEYWNARELQIVLNYKEWRKFEGVIKKAKKVLDIVPKVLTANNNRFTDILDVLKTIKGD